MTTAVRGGSLREIGASAAGGFVSGVITGASIASGVGIVAVVGGFIGGTTGNVVQQSIANGEINRQTALTAGVVSGLAAGLTVGASAGINYVVNNAWGNVASVVTAPAGSGIFSAAYVNAYNTQKTAAVFKPIAETIIAVTGGAVTNNVPARSNDSKNK